MSDPRVTDNEAASRFEIALDGEVVGYSEYRRRGTALSVMHTEVDPAYEGQGLGSALVRGILDAARAEGSEVLPFCPFVRSWIGKHPDYADLVPADRHAELGLA